MPDSRKLYYKTCRENAKISQELAVEQLRIADVPTLSRYENGHVKPDQKLVAEMVRLYRTPLLAVWHIRYANPDLAPWLPEVEVLASPGDVYLQGDIARDLLTENLNEFKRIAGDGESLRDNPDVIQVRDGIRGVANKSQSIVTYIDKELLGGPEDAAQEVSK